jgi:hypothetical protein
VQRCHEVERRFHRQRCPSTKENDMRRFPLLVLLATVLASLPGLPLPARNASAAPIGPTCEQKRSTCQLNAKLNALQCEIQRLGDCSAKYEEALGACERSYRICKFL